MDQEPGDPAEAFEQLRAEVALMRRAVERLSAERAELPRPKDYDETLGAILKAQQGLAGKLDRIVTAAALAMTPDQVAGQLARAVDAARRDEQQRNVESRAVLERAASQIDGIAGAARSTKAQNRQLLWFTGAGLLTGILIWTMLPGIVARELAPPSWHWPERMAARTERLPVWEAGEHLMETASPAAFSAIVAGDKIVTANRETIEGCRKAATKARDTVRCTIRVGVVP